MHLWKNLLQLITRLKPQPVNLERAEPDATWVEEIPVSQNSPIDLVPFIDNLELLRLYKSMDLAG